MNLTQNIHRTRRYQELRHASYDRRMALRRHTVKQHLIRTGANGVNLHALCNASGLTADALKQALERKLGRGADIHTLDVTIAPNGGGLAVAILANVAYGDDQDMPGREDFAWEVEETLNPLFADHALAVCNLDHDYPQPHTVGVYDLTKYDVRYSHYYMRGYDERPRWMQRGDAIVGAVATYQTAFDIEPNENFYTP